MTGILAVWNDRAPEIAGIYEHWYLTDHLPDRLSVPGFRLGRRFEAIAADREFLTYYRVDRPAVLSSELYRARLAEPTEGTVQVMPYWRGMVRAVCDVEVGRGRLDGAALLSLRWPAGREPALQPSQLPDLFSDLPGLCRWELWRANGEPSASGTREAATRREPDGAIAAALIVECCRTGDLEHALERWREAPGAGRGEIVGRYRFLCALAALPDDGTRSA